MRAKPSTEQKKRYSFAFVGVDAGASMGLAVLNKRGKILYLSRVELPKERRFFVATKKLKEVLVSTRKDLSKRERRHPILVVGLEEPPHFQPRSWGRRFSKLQWLFGAILSAAEEKAHVIFLFSPGEVKKFFTGTGWANKKLMVEVAQEKFNLKSLEDHHLANALACADLARHRFLEALREREGEIG